MFSNAWLWIFIISHRSMTLNTALFSRETMLTGIYWLWNMERRIGTQYFYSVILVRLNTKLSRVFPHLMMNMYTRWDSWCELLSLKPKNKILVISYFQVLNTLLRARQAVIWIYFRCYKHLRHSPVKFGSSGLKFRPPFGRVCDLKTFNQLV